MTTPQGVLALVSDQGLRDDVERVAAAAGIRVVHATEPSSRKVWTAALAVLLDTNSARRCAELALPRREHVILVQRAEPLDEDWRTAISVGATHLMALPRQDGDLVAALSEATEACSDDDRRGFTAAVIGGRGGAGASTLAAALAVCAGDGLLVDADPWGGGVDLLLGAERVGGLRWPELTLGAGRVSWDALRDALPRHGAVSVLAAGRGGTEITAAAVSAVTEAGVRGGVTVVCDVPRRSTPAAEAALDAADIVVLVTTADVRACASAAAMAAWLTGTNPNVGVVVRGPAPGGLRAAEVAAGVGLPLLAAMRPQPGLAAALEQGGLRIGRRSPLAVTAGRVLEVLGRHRAAVPA
ncbi:septum site-determining protein Ssd [Mycolicibacterium sp. F2034L]|uniref:septum site-determining protein Ssd n=1 Tax=Mycolicibacterium sp. F2034L TaxID=2926422 RepID=UPI001FF2F249|nr:septum site-determining protein Ssd [Mycolicibacterium sp. F2034L]MCK0176426.1 CpaE-like family protein [Mycolicibacterium sp. F2034L]